MADTRWTPYRSLAGLQAGLDRMFADVLDFGDDSERTTGLCAWRPTVDIVETADAYLLHVEAPGVRREDISIEIRNDVLTLSGERRPSEACRNGRYLRSERIFGRFERSFSIPSSVDPGTVRASFKDGVLRVSVPKAGGTGTRKVEIE